MATRSREANREDLLDRTIGLLIVIRGLKCPDAIRQVVRDVVGMTTEELVALQDDLSKSSFRELELVRLAS